MSGFVFVAEHCISWKKNIEILSQRSLFPPMLILLIFQGLIFKILITKNVESI